MELNTSKAPIFRDKNNRTVYLVGCNYWPSSSAIRMWQKWNPAELEDDIKTMKRLGMNTCRFFLFLPDFLPTPDRVEPEMISRLRQFLQICEKHELYTLPSFFVGHMSGEDWDFPWRNGRDFFRDPVMLQAEILFVTTIVNSIKNSPAIIGWLLSNELPNYAPGASPEEVAEWTNKIISEIRKIDPKRPVSVGDGAWAPEIIGSQTNYSLRLLNQYQDFVGIHYYPRGISPWRHSFTTAFRLQMALPWNKPVIVEEFGTSTTLCSEENQAHYYRTVLYSAFINGSKGVLNWCLNDFDFENERPYSHHFFEESFGIIRTDKSEKPAAKEISRFNHDLNSILKSRWNRIDPSVGLFIPSDYYYPYPYLFSSHPDRYEFYLEAFSLLKRANLFVRCLHEPAQDIGKNGQYSHSISLNPETIPVLFIPRFQFITKRFYREILNYVEKGGVLYFSFAVNTWVKDWQNLAGVKMDCKFGVPDFRQDKSLMISADKDWGYFSKNDRFEIPLFHDDPEFSFAPILDTNAEILFSDQYDHPVLIKNSFGKGKIYFSPYPMEMYAHKSIHDEWKKSLSQIYRSILKAENKHLPYFELIGDGVECATWENKTSSVLRILLVNHSWNPVNAELNGVLPGLKIINPNSNISEITKNRYEVHLQRKEIAWLHLSIPEERTI